MNTTLIVKMLLRTRCNVLFSVTIVSANVTNKLPHHHTFNSSLSTVLCSTSSFSSGFQTVQFSSFEMKGKVQQFEINVRKSHKLAGWGFRGLPGIALYITHQSFWGNSALWDWTFSWTFRRPSQTSGTQAMGSCSYASAGSPIQYRIDLNVLVLIFVHGWIIFEDTFRRF